MSARIGLVVNPRSHRVARHGAVLDAVRQAEPSAMMLRLDDFASLQSGMAAMARQNVRRIFIEGGDGTVHGVLSACLAPQSGFATPPDFAVLSGGSTNLAHKVLGFRGQTKAEIAGRIKALAHGEAATRVPHRALSVEGAGLALPAVGFLLSTGSLPRAMLYAQRNFHGAGRRGSFALAAAILRFVLAPGRYLDADGLPLLRPSSLRVDGIAGRLPDSHAFSVLTSLPSLSLGLNPFWGAEKGPVAITHAGWPITGFRRSVLRILFQSHGKDLAAHGFTSFRSGRVTLWPADRVMMDGEVLTLAPGSAITVTATPELGFLR